MRADIDGVQHRISFNHRMEFQEYKGRRVPQPFSVNAEFMQGDLREDGPVFITRARAVTACRILTGTTKETRQVIASALAVCSWSEPAFIKEFARQLSLARVLTTLPRETGIPLLLAYLHSGPGGHRTLCDLWAASRCQYRTLSEALREK